MGLKNSYSLLLKYKPLTLQGSSEKRLLDNGGENIISNKNAFTTHTECSPVSQQSIFLC